MKNRILASVLSLIIIFTTILVAIPGIAVTAASNLATPQVTSLDCTGAGVEINWRAVSGAKQYAIFVRESDGWYRLTRTSQTHYTYRAPTSGKSYTFTVRCCDYYGTYTSSFYSPGWSTVWCSTPSISSLENTSNGIKISWNTTTKAPAYRLFLKKNGSWTGFVNVTATNASTMSYTYPNVSSGNSYTFTIRAITTDGRHWLSYYNPTGWTKTYSKPASTQLATPRPKFSSVASGVKISWDAVKGAEKYRVFYYGSKGWTRMADVASTEYIDTDVRSGSTYTYTVRCISADGNTYTSDFLRDQRFTYVRPQLTTPQFTMTNVKDGVEIEWPAVSGAEKYRVFYYGSKGWTRMADTKETKYFDEDVRSGNHYTYTVRCITSDGNTYTSDFLRNRSIRYIATPMPTATVAETGVKISWDAVRGAEKYRVFYMPTWDKKNWYELKDTTSTEFTDTSIKSGTMRGYTVRCINSDGECVSGLQSTYEITYFAPPQLSLTNETNGIHITWKSVPGASNYRIYVKSNGSGWKAIKDTTGTDFTYTSVTNGTKYTFTARCISADGSEWLSDYFSGWSITRTKPTPQPTQAPTVKPTEAPKPTQAPTQPPTQPATQAPTVKPADPTPTATVTPTVHVYDGKISVSWNAVTDATKYVVKTYFASQGINNPFDTKTVTTTSTTMNHVFTKKTNQSYYGETFLTAVIAYKNNTAVTTAKPVSTTTVGKFISRRGNERIRTIFTVNRDINFCNVCGKWMKNAYQTNLMGKISPDEACMSHQPYHKGADNCDAGSYRCWKVQWPSGLMNYEQSDNANYHQYWSIVDTNWAYDYYPTVTTAPSISSIQKVSYTKEIHPQQLDNTISASDRTDFAPLMQADGALEISFKPVDSNIKIYDIWVKTTDAKSVNKLTQIPAEGDKYNNVPRYNGFDGRWTYDEKYNDWAVIGYVLVTDSGYESYCYFTDTRTGSFCNKTVTTSNLSTLVYTLPNWYGNEYNSCYDWNMLDNNTKYEFAIQPRLDRTGTNDYYSDTVPASPRGQSKSYTWTGRDYEYYTENNAYFQGASFRDNGLKSKSLELYAEQRNLNWKTWGNFWLYQIGHDDRTGKDYITENTTMPLINGYRIPARTNFEHNGGIYEWKGYNQDGNYALATRATAIKHSNTHKEGNTATFTIASHGVYARTSMYDVWSKRNNYGKHITLIDHNIPYYDPLCYEFTIDGQYRYYYEDIDASFVKQRPSNYTPAVPDSKATKKSTNEHLYESEIRPDLYEK